jgi:nucleoside-diphosphate-sugar epimerase
MPEGSHRSCLVTGASGFLGRHLVSQLLADGWSVASAGVAALPDVPHIPFDLSGKQPAPRLDAVDCVFHLAGLAHRVPRTPAEADEFFLINARGTERVLDAFTNPPAAFLLVSTVAVYGRETGEALTEETMLDAKDPYGRSKIEAETAVRRWAERTGNRAAILRLPLVIGSTAPGNFGRMVEAIRRGRYAGIGSGDARRSMVLASDVAGIASKAASAGGTYHLTDGCHPSFAELENALSHSLGRRRPPHIPMPVAKALAFGGDLLERTGKRMPFSSRTLEKMTASLTFSDQRARNALGWSPRRVVDAIPEIVRAW